MTQRFYFDLKNGHDFIRDDEGVEAGDINQATTQAQAVMEEMRHSGELSSQGEGWSLVIRGESGDPLRTLPLA